MTAGIEIAVDDDGMAHIDLERSREWEAESEADCLTWPPCGNQAR